MSRRDRYRAATPPSAPQAEPEPTEAEAPRADVVEETSEEFVARTISGPVLGVTNEGDIVVPERVEEDAASPEEPRALVFTEDPQPRPGWVRCIVTDPLRCNGVEYAEGDVADFPEAIAATCTALKRA